MVELFPRLSWTINTSTNNNTINTSTTPLTPQQTTTLASQCITLWLLTTGDTTLSSTIVHSVSFGMVHELKADQLTLTSTPTLTPTKTREAPALAAASNVSIYRAICNNQIWRTGSTPRKFPEHRLFTVYTSKSRKGSCAKILFSTPWSCLLQLVTTAAYSQMRSCISTREPVT